MKDEALTPAGFLMESLPIARPLGDQRSLVEAAARRLIEIVATKQNIRRDILDWLKIEHGIDAPSADLREPFVLDSDSFIAEVRKIRGRKNPLTLAAVRNLREEFTRTIIPAQAIVMEARSLELSISDLVNAAYGLTDDEIKLMWETAPPRMPIAQPQG